MNLPDSHFLPAPLALITLLHVVTLTLHFAAMNVLVGSVVVILFGRFTDRWDHPTVLACVRVLPSAMAMTVSLGVAPLLFVQLVYPGPIYSAAIVSGWFWLMIIAVVIGTYYLLYAASFAAEGKRARIPTLLVLSLIGFLYVSFVYSSVFSMAERAGVVENLYARDTGGWTIHPDVGVYLYRWLHMLTGAITVGAFSVVRIGRDDAETVRIGKRFFLAGMILAALTGFLYLMGLGDALVPFMRSAGIRYLAGGIVLSIASVVLFYRGRFVGTAITLFLSLLGMVAARQELRQVRLDAAYDPAAIPVHPQWSVFSLFLVCFIAALIVIVWMVRLYRAGGGQAESAPASDLNP